MHPFILSFYEKYLSFEDITTFQNFLQVVFQNIDN